MMMNRNYTHLTKIKNSRHLAGKELQIIDVTISRLNLYNKGLNHNPKAIQQKMHKDTSPSLPSAKILSDQYLTNGRTGYYAEDYRQQDALIGGTAMD